MPRRSTRRRWPAWLWRLTRRRWAVGERGVGAVGRGGLLLDVGWDGACCHAGIASRVALPAELCLHMFLLRRCAICLLRCRPSRRRRWLRYPPRRQLLTLPPPRQRAPLLSGRRPSGRCRRRWRGSRKIWRPCRRSWVRGGCSYWLLNWLFSLPRLPACMLSCQQACSTARLNTRAWHCPCLACLAADETQQCADAATEHVRFLEEKQEADSSEHEAAVAALQQQLEAAQGELAAAQAGLAEAQAKAAADLEAAAEGAAAEVVRVQVCRARPSGISLGPDVCLTALPIHAPTSTVPLHCRPPLPFNRLSCCRRRLRASTRRCWLPSGRWRHPRLSWRPRLRQLRAPSTPGRSSRS